MIYSKKSITPSSLSYQKIEALHPEDYRLIALCNAIFKILTKSLANRLIYVTSLIIYDEQQDLILGISIMDGIIIIQELIHFFDPKGNLSIVN